ncbi:MAG: hypothetical protein Q4D61_06925, partial [Cardiobacteriaceae bacterium]|nr:hypothetical protein [Cardiobacteriaceae bacterium]
MQTDFTIWQATKPLMLASAIALALTACGGSNSGDAPLADQPSTPLKPSEDNSQNNKEKTPAPNPKPDNNGSRPGNHQGGNNQTNNNQP